MSSIAVRSGRFALAVALCVIALPAEVLAQSAVPSSGPPLEPQPLPAESAPIAPGRYRSGVGTGTNVTFDVADHGWVGQGGAMVVMDRAAGDDAGELMVTTFDAAAVDPCLREAPDTNGSQDVAQDAQAFTQWLLAQPRAVSTSSQTTLGGEPAIQVDISALKPPCPDQSMFVWYYLDGGPYRLFPTEAVRVIAQDRGGELVLVTAETVNAASLPAFLEAATPVIESMTFDDAAPLVSHGPVGSPAT